MASLSKNCSGFSSSASLNQNLPVLALKSRTIETQTPTKTDFAMIKTSKCDLSEISIFAGKLQMSWKMVNWIKIEVN